MNIEILWAAFLVCAIAIICWVLAVLRRKHRLIWKQFWSIRDELHSIREANIELRKEMCLSSVEKLRLPNKMPSHNGEDLLLWRFFEKRRRGFFVEIGAYDGITFSNTYFLEAVGWSGILVEPNPDKFKECVRNRPFSKSVQAAIRGPGGDDSIDLFVPEGPGGIDTLSYTFGTSDHRQRVERTAVRVRQLTVPAMTLAELLGETNEPIDVLSIDVEGAEIDVLKGIDLDKADVAVLIVEDNSLGRDHVVVEYLRERGYVERTRLEANIFFSRSDDQRSFL